MVDGAEWFFEMCRTVFANGLKLIRQGAHSHGLGAPRASTLANRFSDRGVVKALSGPALQALPSGGWASSFLMFMPISIPFYLVSIPVYRYGRIVKEANQSLPGNSPHTSDHRNHPGRPLFSEAHTEFCPCDTRTPTCRNLATMFSGVCLLLGISVLLNAKRHWSSQTTSKGMDQSALVRRVGLFGNAIRL